MYVFSWYNIAYACYNVEYTIAIGVYMAVDIA